MGRILFGLIAAVASFMLVDSLTCNQCSLGLFGICPSSDETCAANVTDCFTGQATFPSFTSFSGFSSLGCRADSSTCNATTNATLLGFTYQTKIDCCSTDKCNTVSGAPSAKMSLSAAVSVAVLASVLGNMLS